MTSIQAQAVLFGFDASPVALEVIPRTRQWRLVGAARSLAISMVAALFVAILPPHAPWVIGALAAGAFFARRRWTETHTLAGVDGVCPKCGASFETRPTRLKRPHPLECEGCHHVSELRLPDGALPEAS